MTDSAQSVARDSELTALDWIAAVLAALGALFCLQFPFFVAPAFRSMFADFDGPLPRITLIGLTPWFPLALAAIPIGILAVAVAGTSALRRRRALIVVAFLAALASSAVCLYAVYAPIFAVAGAVK